MSEKFSSGTINDKHTNKQISRYMTDILPIRRKTLSNKSFNQSINQSIPWWQNKKYYLSWKMFLKAMIAKDNYNRISLICYYLKISNTNLHKLLERGFRKNFGTEWSYTTTRLSTFRVSGKNKTILNELLSVKTCKKINIGVYLYCFLNHYIHRRRLSVNILSH